MKQNHLSYRWNQCSVFKKKISSSLLSLTFCISEVISALLQLNSLWPMVVGAYSSFIQILGQSNFSPKSAALSTLRQSLNLINCRSFIKCQIGLKPIKMQRQPGRLESGGRKIETLFCRRFVVWASPMFFKRQTSFAKCKSGNTGFCNKLVTNKIGQHFVTFFEYFVEI